MPPTPGPVATEPATGPSGTRRWSGMRTDVLLQRWLYLVCGAHVAVGVTMPWMLQTPLGRAYLAHLATRFGIEDLPAETAALLRWLLVLFGAMIASWGLLMAGLVRLACQTRSTAPLHVLAAALLAWAALDMGWSASRGVWLHLWLDALALLVILLPLSALHQRLRADHGHRAADGSRGSPSA